VNAKHLELYSIIAECNGARYPIAYCLLSTAELIEIGKHATALTAWVEQIKLKHGVNPHFTHVDQDMAEISTLRGVWDPKVALCWWHMRKAIHERLAKNKVSTTPYNAAQASEDFSFIDPTFQPLSKPNTKEHEGGIRDDFEPLTPAHDSPNSIQIYIPATLPKPSHVPQKSVHLVLGPSSVENSPRSSINMPVKITVPLLGCDKENVKASLQDREIEDKATSHTFCSEEFHQGIMDMVECHYHAHPLIPGHHHPSHEGVQEWAVRRMYQFCIKYDLCEVWAYLWENWYRKGRWELWACSKHDEIPVLKTTMILESQYVFNASIK